MIKIILKRVPKKMDKRTSHDVYKLWVSAMVEIANPKADITVIRGTDIENKSNKEQLISEKIKSNHL